MRPLTCAARKAAAALTATSSDTTTADRPKPLSPPSITPYVSAPIATTAVTCPSASSRAGSRGEGRHPGEQGRVPADPRGG